MTGALLGGPYVLFFVRHFTSEGFQTTIQAALERSREMPAALAASEIVNCSM